MVRLIKKELKFPSVFNIGDALRIVNLCGEHLQLVQDFSGKRMNTFTIGPSLLEMLTGKK